MNWVWSLLSLIVALSLSLVEVCNGDRNEFHDSTNDANNSEFNVWDFTSYKLGNNYHNLQCTDIISSHHDSPITPKSEYISEMLSSYSNPYPLASGPLHTVLLIIVVGGLALLVYPQVTWTWLQRHPVHIWRPLRRMKIFRWMFVDYFPLSLHSAPCHGDSSPKVDGPSSDDESSNSDSEASASGQKRILDPGHKYLFGYHPHGVYSYGLFSMVFPELSGWENLYPGVSVLVGVANGLLCVPLLCTLLEFLGFIPASEYALSTALQQGYSVAIVPGGIAEMIVGEDSDNEVVYLRKRTGFVRFAITHGVHLVPVYGFGETRTFKRYSFWKEQRLKLSRKLRFIIQLYRGRWYFPIPFQVPIDVVVGNPVKVEQCDDPSDELVQETLQKYIKELQSLFESNKHRFDEYKNKELEIL